MRINIDLDDSLLKRLRDKARAQGVPVHTLLDRIIQCGLDQKAAAPEEAPHNVPSFSLGQLREGGNLVKALELASTLED